MLYNGAVSGFRECGLPYGLRDPLCTLQLFRSAFHLLDSCNTRYGWGVSSYPAGTFTLQETPSSLGARRGREGGCPPSPRTDPGVRYYRTGLFRHTRFRNSARPTNAIAFSEVGLVCPALRVRSRFPLQATCVCQPLPHVNGPTVSEYYGLIRLPATFGSPT